MSWQLVVEKISEFFDKPVPIIGCTIGFLLITILTIISKTSIGKKALFELRKLHKVANENCKKAEQVAKDFCEKTTEQVDQLINSYENHIKEQDEKIKLLENLIISITGNLHNAKIKAITNEYVENNIEKEMVAENGEK